MIAAIAVWQWLLDGLGSILAWLFGIVGNYGIAIILLTIVLKVVLLPLAWKQIKSMQHMQAIQPKIKELQKKYKSNKPKQQEETMRLYREAGVNPLGGCLPVLLLYPFLIAMYQIIAPVTLIQAPDQPGAYQIAVNKVHVPEDSELLQDMLVHENLNFLGMNLQCTPLTAGTMVTLTYQDADGNAQPLPDGAPILGENGQPLSYEAITKSTLSCGGERFPSAIPYFLILVLMSGSGFYMQRQMSKNMPTSAQMASQQAILKYMPIMFGVFGVNFPAGLLVYWTSSNLFQVAQQTIMLRLGHMGPGALDKRIEEQKARAASGETKQGLMTRLSSRAEEAQKAREQKAKADGSPAKGGSSSGGPTKGARPPGKRGNSGGKPAKGAPPGNQLKKEK